MQRYVWLLTKKDPEAKAINLMKSGKELLEAKKYEKAIEKFSEAIKIYTTLTGPRLETAEADFHRAKAYYAMFCIAFRDYDFLHEITLKGLSRSKLLYAAREDLLRALTVTNECIKVHKDIKQVETFRDDIIQLFLSVMERLLGNNFIKSAKDLLHITNLPDNEYTLKAFRILIAGEKEDPSVKRTCLMALKRLSDSKFEWSTTDIQGVYYAVLIKSIQSYRESHPETEKLELKEEDIYFKSLGYLPVPDATAVLERTKEQLTSGNINSHLRPMFQSALEKFEQQQMEEQKQLVDKRIIVFFKGCIANDKSLKDLSSLKREVNEPNNGATGIKLG